MEDGRSFGPKPALPSLLSFSGIFLLRFSQSLPRPSVRYFLQKTSGDNSVPELYNGVTFN